MTSRKFLKYWPILKKVTVLTSKGDKLTDKDKLRATVKRLRVKVKILKNAIITIKQSETFQTIIGIVDWGEYFTKTKKKLQQQLEELQFEIKPSKSHSRKKKDS